jgi:hypothetical protein
MCIRDRYESGDGFCCFGGKEIDSASDERSGGEGDY